MVLLSHMLFIVHHIGNIWACCKSKDPTSNFFSHNKTHKQNGNECTKLAAMRLRMRVLTRPQKWLANFCNQIYLESFLDTRPDQLANTVARESQ